MEYDDSVEIEALDENLTFRQTGIKTKGPHNLSLAWKQKIDLSEISSKNPSHGLVRPM